MTDDRTIVDLIERVSDAEPMCACGRHTTPVWRDGIVWLDCASLLEFPDQPPRTPPGRRDGTGAHAQAHHRGPRAGGIGPSGVQSRTVLRQL